MEPSQDTLSAALGRWKVTPAARGDFRSAVWQRIRKSDQQTWPVYLRSHAGAWALLGVVSLGAAAYTGRAAAQARVRADREMMVVSYLVDLDPRAQAVLKP